MPHASTIGGGHCSFFQFWPPGVLWFPMKSVVGGGIGGVMVNQKNVVAIFFSLFYLFSVIWEQFVDCKLFIVMHYNFIVHKLVQNYIEKRKFLLK